jgi:hypothetical protein
MNGKKRKVNKTRKKFTEERTMRKTAVGNGKKIIETSASMSTVISASAINRKDPNRAMKTLKKQLWRQYDENVRKDANPSL